MSQRSNPYDVEIGGLRRDDTAVLVPSVPAGRTSADYNPGGAVDINRGNSRIVLRTVLGDRPETLTVCLTRRDLPAAGESASADNVDVLIVCKLEFGAGRAVEICEVDWIHGTLLTVPAGSITISARYEKPVFGVDENDALRQSLGAIVTKGTRSGAAGIVPMARRSQRLAPLAAGGTDALEIPARAHALTLLTDKPEDYGSYRARWDTASDAVQRRILATSLPSGEEQIFPNGARKVWLVNNSANIARLTAVWSIAL